MAVRACYGESRTVALPRKNPHSKQVTQEKEKPSNPNAALAALNLRSLKTRQAMNTYFSHVPQRPEIARFHWQHPDPDHDEMVESAAELLLQINNAKPEVCRMCSL